MADSETHAVRAHTDIPSPSLELPILAVGTVVGPLPDRRQRDRLIRRAKALSWLSLVYMTAEGAIAITAAVMASSVALLGFGLDSAIEALASIIVIWRFTGTRRLSDHAEQRAQRLVAITFFLLAPYIAQDAIRALINGQHATASRLGIALSISSIIVMPLLGRAKLRVGRALASRATAGEGNQNLLCAYLAAGVLSGLVLNLAFGVWWADPAIALGIAAVAVNEGRHFWAGEDCCAASPISSADAGGCHAKCCADRSRSAACQGNRPSAHGNPT